MRFEAQVIQEDDQYVGKVIDCQTGEVVYETEPTTRVQAVRDVTTRAYTPSTEHCLRF